MRCGRGHPADGTKRFSPAMLARKNYRLWSANPFHLSLHFKLIGKPNWSARLGGHYRAVGKFSGDGFLWEWIGKHEDYNKWLKGVVVSSPF